MPNTLAQEDFFLNMETCRMESIEKFEQRAKETIDKSFVGRMLR